MIEKLLNVDNLYSSYEGTPLLKGINFFLDEAEILCLLGPSGSGKTTLLRLIAGLEGFDQGRIIFRGRDLSDTPPHLRNFGMMFQEYALFPHKNVTDNIAFGLSMQKLPQSAIRKRVEEMLELVSLRQYAKSRINELSGGERQRVALARSLAPSPELLLLDEPLGSLDRALRDRLAADIRTILKKLGVTAIFVTHDQSEAFGVADKIAILQDGFLQQMDSPEKIYRKPATQQVAAFLGFRNFLDGRIHADNVFSCQLGEFHLPHSKDNIVRENQNATLLILPEGVSFQPERITTGTSIRGIVKTRTFLGAIYRVQVDVSGCSLFFDFPNRPSPPGPGEKIEIFIEQADTILFPGD